MSKTAPKNKGQTFTDILDRAPSTIEPPKLMPMGTYIGMTQGMPRIDKSTKKQTPFVEFSIKYLGAEEDVDQEQLAAAGGIAEKTIKATYYTTENSAFMLKDFLIALGINLEEYDTLREALDDTPGKQLKFTVRHEASQDGQRMFARFGTAIPVE